jgi:hypothetical protein
VALPVAMVQPALNAPLMPAVGTAPLPKPRLAATLGTAIALAPVAVLAYPEHSLAPALAANQLPENDFPLNCHPGPQAALDNGSRS